MKAMIPVEQIRQRIRLFRSAQLLRRPPFMQRAQLLRSAQLLRHAPFMQRAQLLRRPRLLLASATVACLAGGAVVLAGSVAGSRPEPASLSVRSWPSLYDPLPPPPKAGVPARDNGSGLPKLDLRTCAAALSVPVTVTVPPIVRSLIGGLMGSTTTTTVAGSTPSTVPLLGTPLGALPASTVQAILEYLQSIAPRPGTLPVSGGPPGSPGSSSDGGTTTIEAPGVAFGQPGGIASLLDMTGGTCIPVGLESAVSLGSSAVQADALTLAENQLGTPYVWGGETKGEGFDCSGLVQWVFDAAGVALPRGAQAQFEAGPPVPWGAKVVPGDLVFFGGGPGSVEHVGIVAGSGWMVDAPHTGAVVRFDRIAGFGNVVGVTSPGGVPGGP